MRIRHLIQTAPLVISHSWWSARKWLACSSSPEQDGQPLNLAALEDRVLFDAMPLVVAVAEADAEAPEDLTAGIGGPLAAVGGRDGITITDLAGVTTESLGRGTDRSGLLEGESFDGDATANDFLAGLTGGDETVWATGEATGSQLQRLELVFVDSGVGNLDELMKDLERQDSTRPMQVIVLDAATDGVLQVTDALQITRMSTRSI